MPILRFFLLNKNIYTYTNSYKFEWKRSMISFVFFYFQVFLNYKYKIVVPPKLFDKAFTIISILVKICTGNDKKSNLISLNECCSINQKQQLDNFL